jgi:GntR family transcriptional regulator/MocR family aminotransferase
MNVRYRVELSQAEREELTKLLSGGKQATRKLKRAQILLGADARLVGVPVDDQGLVVSRIPANCQLVFTTPSHQFPTAVTMSRSRRRQLLAAARSQDFLILEDDYDADLNLSTAPPLPLRTVDDHGHVIYVGSLSKTISPGMRLGFMVAHRDIIREARIVRGLMLRHAPTVVQETAALFLGLGYHDAHLRQISRRYRNRWQTMRSSIERHLGAFHLTNTVGGTTFWLTGPPSFDASALSERLRKRGVIIDKGQPFYLDGDNLRSFRLGFAYVDVSKIDDGIALIAEEAARQLKVDPGRRDPR